MLLSEFIYCVVLSINHRPVPHSVRLIAACDYKMRYFRVCVKHFSSPGSAFFSACRRMLRVPLRSAAP